MIKKIFALILLIAMLTAFIACESNNATPSGDSIPYESKSGIGDISYRDAYMTGDSEGVPYEGGGEGEETQEQDIERAPGQLTAKALFDNDDYDYFYSLGIKGQTDTGVFYTYQEKFNLTKNRIKVIIENGPLAKVDLLNENDEVVCTRLADKNGVVYLFGEKKDSYKIRVVTNPNDENGYETFNVENGDTITLENATTFVDKIEIALVVDTTGSMGDEIGYLKSELKDVINKISQNSTNPISLALIFYRDEGDEYVTRVKDYSTNIDEQVDYLSKQSAEGGGDFEEAIESAYEKAVNLQWTTGKTTKILIHVADAPCHDDKVDKCSTYVNKLAEKGVRIINVASSGIDKKTEYFFRNQCVKTNGCYAFLTDDSGISVGEHLEATINKDLPVEYLNKLLVRVINGMHTGTYDEAEDIRKNKQDNQQNNKEQENIDGEEKTE